ncbi:hypothetical protein MNBD_ACTINO02-2230 [hydrothermal vent metagenome]|uniref:FAD dependent oxidoreductase domain-containing protein n=1 Tax=hydrothermal vent metagenome TaxID=652676 RepID=A0A3B0RWL9_9ZZZZ
MSETADVVVVGGGIIGLSIAYQTARRSNLKVTVCEKGAGIGEGSTGYSSAITRQRYTHESMVRIARDGNRVFRNWGDFTGLANPGARLNEIGVVWMTGEPGPQLEEEAAQLRELEVDAVVIDRDELAARFPSLDPCLEPLDLTGGVDHECKPGNAFLYERDAGYFDSTSGTQDLVEASRREGVQVRFSTEVTNVRTSGGRIAGVDLKDGSSVDSPIVVNAAGPWCMRINAMLDYDPGWDLVPTRVQVVHRSLPPLSGPLPVVGDVSSGIYFRPDANGQSVIVGSLLEKDEEEEVDPDHYSNNAERAFIEEKIIGLHHRIPELESRGKLGGIAGLYTFNRVDVHAILGETPIEGYLISNGFTGHGLKESPMVGSMMAQLITGERASYDTDVDMSFLSVDRDPITVATKNVLA